MTVNLSAIVLAKNEESTIRDCLNSLSFCDERIVIDDFSTDKTAEIAKELGAKVYKHPLENDFARQRNFGLEKASGDWVLFIDADERVNHSLQYEITTEISNPMDTVVGYFIKRHDTLWGRKVIHGEIGSTTLLRLAKKSAGKWKGRVHEAWEIKGKRGALTHKLDHFPHQSLREFLREINYYSTIRAEELHKMKKKIYVHQIAVYPIGKFMYNYVVRLGFLDGLPGFMIAIMMSFHSFLVRGKLWHLSKNNS